MRSTPLVEANTHRLDGKAEAVLVNDMKMVFEKNDMKSLKTMMVMLVDMGIDSEQVAYAVAKGKRLAVK